MVTEEQVKLLAYSEWEQEGRPEGKHLEHYYRAKQMLEEREDNLVPVTDPVSPSSTSSRAASTTKARGGKSRSKKS